ncbi:LPXTG-motif protein cell wall anchor domain protein [Enterococcus faecalis 13-SD-W-01]|nr:LPXTG-motif protein cell wall anchor domain protein [Enterococcus faecalis 13-SD-W-01]
MSVILVLLFVSCNIGGQIVFADNVNSNVGITFKGDTSQNPAGSSTNFSSTNKQESNHKVKEILPKTNDNKKTFFKWTGILLLLIGSYFIKKREKKRTIK